MQRVRLLGRSSPTPQARAKAPEAARLDLPDLGAAGIDLRAEPGIDRLLLLQPGGLGRRVGQRPGEHHQQPAPLMAPP
ncbi:MAG: hypothetical protein U0869_07110 [Chloroflexota bacterium]